MPQVSRAVGGRVLTMSHHHEQSATVIGRALEDRRDEHERRDQNGRKYGRRDTDKRSQGVAQWLVWLPVILAIFTAGYNWRRIDELSAQLTVHERWSGDLEQQVRTDYVRKDVMAEQYLRLLNRLESLEYQIQEMRRERR